VLRRTDAFAARMPSLRAATLVLVVLELVRLDHVTVDKSA